MADAAVQGEGVAPEVAGSTMSAAISSPIIRKWGWKPSFRNLLKLKYTAESPIPNQHLCGRCKLIDFDVIFALNWGQLPQKGRPVADLGELTVEMRTANCELCALFANAFFFCEERGVYEGRNCSLRAFDSLQMVGLSDRDPYKTERPWIVLAVVLTNPGQQMTTKWILEECVESVLLLANQSDFRDDRESPCTYDGRVVDRLNVDYDMVRKWLADCVTLHKECGQKKQSPNSLRVKVLDCHNRTVVELPDRERYLALSYVWGNPKPTLPDVVSLQALPKVLPVIEDAMRFVNKLGLRYLWVDSLCINQEPHNRERDEQIRVMDHIYEGAHAVVVSLGKHADEGLPGLGNILRAKQSSARISHGQLVHTMMRSWRL